VELDFLAVLVVWADGDWDSKRSKPKVRQMDTACLRAN